jgi:hypothetical protein
MKVTNSQVCNQHDPVGRFALECFVVSPKLFEVAPPGSDIELCLTVNGVEVPVGDVIKEWMRICDYSVTSRASELMALCGCCNPYDNRSRATSTRQWENSNRREHAAYA